MVETRELQLHQRIIDLEAALRCERQRSDDFEAIARLADAPAPLVILAAVDGTPFADRSRWTRAQYL